MLNSNVCCKPHDTPEYQQLLFLYIFIHTGRVTSCPQLELLQQLLSHAGCPSYHPGPALANRWPRSNCTSESTFPALRAFSSLSLPVSSLSLPYLSSPSPRCTAPLKTAMGSAANGKFHGAAQKFTCSEILPPCTS